MNPTRFGTPGHFGTPGGVNPTLPGPPDVRAPYQSPAQDQVRPEIAQGSGPEDDGVGDGLSPDEPAREDLAAVAAQLGRPPRGVVEVAHRCPCGLPDVVRTAPRLPDGTPFPTTYYATCPRLTAALSTAETTGLMREMTERLGDDPLLAATYRQAHEDYLSRREELGDVPEIRGVSAGGMPTRVKCLHVLAAHALAAGPGTNPLGDEALACLPPWWSAGPCVATTVDPCVATEVSPCVGTELSPSVATHVRPCVATDERLGAPAESGEHALHPEEPSNGSDAQ